MLTIAIPQLYCGASGQKGAYNRQEVGLARAFASLGHRAVVIYPAPEAAAPRCEDLEAEVRVWYLPVRAWRNHAFYPGWQVLLDEKVDAVHCMGDNSLGVPDLYRFCKNHGIVFYSQLGALKSAADSKAIRIAMDAVTSRNLSVYRATTTYAKTPSVQKEMESLHIPCAGVMPVGLDTAIIPPVGGNMQHVRRVLGLEQSPAAKYLLFVGRLDAYKRPLDLVPLLAALPECWQLIIIGKGALEKQLDTDMAAAGLTPRCRRIPALDNAAVQAYYNACNVFINLNEQEIFGMSLLEAMFAGCPPVARHAPGPDLIIEDGISGFLVGEKIPEIAAAVQCAAENEPMRGAAQKRINEHFLWANSAEIALAMLAKLGLH